MNDTTTPAERPTSNIRVMVRGVYDLQRLRIQMGNRITANFKAKLGQAPSTPESDLDEAEQDTIKELRLEYQRITDGVVEQIVDALPPVAAEGEKPKRARRHKPGNLPTKDQFTGTQVISTYTELCLVHQYLDLDRQEKAQFKMLEQVLSEDPIYTGFLSDVPGVGPAMAGVLLSEIDLAKAKYPSSLWAYSGYDVGGDGRGRSRRSEHLVTREYTAKDGTQKERQGITFNAWLKTKLYVLATSFLRAGDKGYSHFYREYKVRMENHAVHGAHNDGKRNEEGHLIASKGHRHAMAMRYMIKRFLVDYYTHGRSILNLPVAPEYSEAKLGRVHGRGPVAPGESKGVA